MLILTLYCNLGITRFGKEKKKGTENLVKIEYTGVILIALYSEEQCRNNYNDKHNTNNNNNNYSIVMLHNSTR